MYSRTEIVSISTTSIGDQFATRSSCEMVIANFKYLDDAKAALKGLAKAARPGTRLAVRYWYCEEDSYLIDDTTVPELPEFDILDPFDGVPADTGTV